MIYDESVTLTGTQRLSDALFQIFVCNEDHTPGFRTEVIQ